jgi:hypothetical protein
MSAPSRSAAPAITATSDFSDAKMTRKFGDVPNDLITLSWSEDYAADSGIG